MQPLFSILLVDDLPTNLHTLSQILADSYDISIATSGADALRIAEANRPDLILLDVMMPQMDGFETLLRLRGTDWGREIPVMLVTADDRVESQVKGLEAGAEDFIAKPIVAPVLKARVRNVLERLRLHRELVRLATTDELTGVLNRRKFYALAEMHWHLLQRYPAPCGLIMLDLDKFKRINDSHGHAVGDEVLKTFATIVRQGLRKPDVFGRVGGEEFALLLPQTDAQRTLDVAERLRLAVAACDQVSLGTERLRFTVSLGCTQLGGNDVSLDAAMSRADKALYQAKTEGRNQSRQELPQRCPA